MQIRRPRDQDCGELIEFCAAYSVMRDLGLIDK
jgi:hypothetical protein